MSRLASSRPPVLCFTSRTSCSKASSQLPAWMLVMSPIYYNCLECTSGDSNRPKNFRSGLKGTLPSR